MISAVCQGLLSCRRHIGKREDPGDEVERECMRIAKIGPDLRLVIYNVQIYANMLHPRACIEFANLQPTYWKYNGEPSSYSAESKSGSLSQQIEARQSTGAPNEDIVQNHLT